MHPTKQQAYVSVSSCLGYDAPYLLEWIEFHRLVGIERFFLYNNGDREAQRELLAPYVERGVVVLHDWPEFPPQKPSYKHCVREHRSDSRWIAFIDTDEFLFSPTGRPLTELLVEYEEWPGVCANFAVFGTSGHRSKPAGLVIENYIYRTGQAEKNRVYKSIVDPTRASHATTPHDFVYRSGYPVDENKEPVEPTSTESVSFSKLRINHYWTKSQAESRVKFSRSRYPYVDQNRDELLSDERFAIREKFLNQVRDETILMYLPRLREALARAPG